MGIRFHKHMWFVGSAVLVVVVCLIWGLFLYWGLFVRPRPGKVVFLAGLDNCGKTTLLHFLRTFRLETHHPTGFNTTVYNVHLQNSSTKMLFMDMGGMCSRSNLEMFSRRSLAAYSRIRGVAFLIDASDCERLSEARRLLQTELERFSNMPFLIVGTKMDVPHAMTRSELVAFLVSPLVSTVAAQDAAMQVMLINRVRRPLEFGLLLLPRDVARIIATMVWNSRRSSRLWKRCEQDVVTRHGHEQLLQKYYKREIKVAMASVVQRHFPTGGLEWLAKKMDC